ncbi:MAG: glycine cleavage system protein R [Acidimicrobiales bacterium]
MPHFALSAVGADRPGIVAAVTGALVEHGCNLEDTSMSILRGQFVMMLVVAGPDGLDAATLEEALAGPAADLDLVVAVRSVPEDVPVAPDGEAWAVAVYGADRPGIVHRFTSLLAGEGVNILDLTTRVIGEPARPVYAMILEVSLPPGLDGGDLTARLADLANELGVECSSHLSEADIL